MQIRGGSGGHGLTALLDRHEHYETGASCVILPVAQRALEQHGDHRATLNTLQGRGVVD